METKTIPPRTESRLAETIGVPDVLAFVQLSQVAAGHCVPAPSCTEATTAACHVLRLVPICRTDGERGIVACVLVRFAGRFNAPDPTTARSLRAVRNPVARVVEMADSPDAALERVARGVGYSKWHLCRVIRAETGFSFTELVHAVRLYKAIDLLACSASSVKQIAAAVGYRATGELDRQFDRWVHMSPTALRRAFDLAPNQWV
jgi:AraC-like DNA-binding protein